MPVPLLMVGGAVVGAAVWGGAEYLQQRRSGRPMDWGKVGRAALVGGASGALLGGAFSAVRAAAWTTANAAVSGGTIVNLKGPDWIEQGGRAAPSAEPVRAAPPVQGGRSHGRVEGEIIEHDAVMGEWTDPYTGRTYPTTRTTWMNGREVPVRPADWSYADHPQTPAPEPARPRPVRIEPHEAAALEAISEELSAGMRGEQVNERRIEGLVQALGGR